MNKMNLMIVTCLFFALPMYSSEKTKQTAEKDHKKNQLETQAQKSALKMLAEHADIDRKEIKTIAIFTAMFVAGLLVGQE